ncbi:MAG: hypothetical protein GY762_10260 [Proteobacteria bacterium]|nr:hypothetical protein [Pseudomonadota bacterium]
MLNDKQLRLGEILIEAGVLSKNQLKSALALQKKRQLRLGTILLQEGFATEPQVVQALSRRLSVPWVSLWHLDIKDALLDLVPVSVAEEFFLIPIYVRTTEEGGKALYVAMNDPTDDAALRFVAASSGMSVKPMIAGPSDIAAAIRAYYYGEMDDEDSIAPEPVRPPATGGPEGGLSPDHLPKASPPPPPPPPGKAVKAEPDKELGAGDTAPQSVDEGEQVIKEQEQMPSDASEEEKQRTQREVEKHMFGVGPAEKRKGIALTLLDGTKIRFGGGTQQKKTAAGYTADDLIKELRARAAGETAKDGLPSEKWEDYVATILEILFRKHLVFPDEFISEINKRKK